MRQACSSGLDNGMAILHGLDNGMAILHGRYESGTNPLASDVLMNVFKHMDHIQVLGIVDAF